MEMPPPPSPPLSVDICRTLALCCDTKRPCLHTLLDTIVVPGSCTGNSERVRLGQDKHTAFVVMHVCLRQFGQVEIDRGFVATHKHTPVEPQLLNSVQLRMQLQIGMC
jgi:hypothetical protein